MTGKNDIKGGNLSKQKKDDFKKGIDGAMIDGKRPNVLIVEDDESARKFLTKVFKHINFPYLAVESGEEAIELAKKNDFQIAFLDMILLGINGFQTFKAIKEIKPNIKVIVFTGHGAIKMIDECKKLGAFAVLEKPFSLTEIYAVISRTVSSK